MSNLWPSSSFSHQNTMRHVPLELLQKTGNRPVEVNLMDRKGEDYKPPPKVIKPFSGEGQRLGGCVRSNISNPTH